jgi:hypothetical protein
MNSTSTTFAARTSPRAYRLQRIENYLRLGLEATGDERTQRQMLEHMIREAAAVKVPLLECLAQIFVNQCQPEPIQAGPTPVMTAPAVDEFVCETCNRGFKTKHALCGHQRTHGTTVRRS